MFGCSKTLFATIFLTGFLINTASPGENTQVLRDADNGFQWAFPAGWRQVQPSGSNVRISVSQPSGHAHGGNCNVVVVKRGTLSAVSEDEINNQMKNLNFTSDEWRNYLGNPEDKVDIFNHGQEIIDGRVSLYALFEIEKIKTSGSVYIHGKTFFLMTVGRVWQITCGGWGRDKRSASMAYNFWSEVFDGVFSSVSMTTKPPRPDTEWSAYHDQDGRFWIRFPADWNIGKGNLPQTVIRVSDPYETAICSIGVETNEYARGKSASDLAEENKDGGGVLSMMRLGMPDARLRWAEKTYLSNSPAVYTVIEGTAKAVGVVEKQALASIFTWRNGEIYSITCVCGLDDFRFLEKIFKAIMATFTINPIPPK